jgi:hypothetical protein
VLPTTTSCDDGVQFDLARDGCGEVLVAGPVQQRDTQALLAYAVQQGWVVAGAVSWRCDGCTRRGGRADTCAGNYR